MSSSESLIALNIHHVLPHDVDDVDDSLRGDHGVRGGRAKASARSLLLVLEFPCGQGISLPCRRGRALYIQKVKVKLRVGKNFIYVGYLIFTFSIGTLTS